MNLRELEQGSGKVIHLPDEHSTIRLLRSSAERNRYSNAQIDDYYPGLTYQAPLRLQLKATFSHSIDTLKGTAGFGFWNVPFAPGTRRLRFPKAAWFFFGSPPLNLPFVMGVPGHGFKASTIDATHPLFFTLLPMAPIGFLLMRIRPVYRRLWRIGQHAIRADETLLNLDITESHLYQLDWLPGKIIFSIDDEIMYSTRYSPTGKMGFVAWIDNQYAVVTPQGNFGWGLLEESESQWLDIRDLSIQPL